MGEGPQKKEKRGGGAGVGRDLFFCKMNCNLKYQGSLSRFCHTEFEAAKTRSCDKVGTKSITIKFHFFIPGL